MNFLSGENISNGEEYKDKEKISFFIRERKANKRQIQREKIEKMKVFCVIDHLLLGTGGLSIIRNHFHVHVKY